MLLVNHTFRRSDGQGSVNAHLACELLRGGHAVTLVGDDVPDDLSREQRCTAVASTPVRRAPTQLLRHLTFGWRTRRLIGRLRHEHDVVVANGGMTFARTDLNICHFVHASWVRSPHHPSRSASRVSRSWGWYQSAYSKQAVLWERDAYHRAGHIVAVSPLVRQQLIDDVGIDAAKITVIENGSDAPARTAKDGRALARATMGVDDQQFVVLFAGDLKTPRKNFDVLLAALRHLPEDVVLVAAGAHEAGPYPGLAHRLGVAARVKFLGMRDDLLKLYAGADVFALLSHYEPFGLVVTEALAAGVPVVTASSVGASDVVRRHGCGMVMDEATDDAAVAAALRTLRDDLAMRQHMGQRGLGVPEELAWSKVGERYMAVLKDLIDRRNP